MLKSSILSILGRNARISSGAADSSAPAPDARRYVRTETCIPAALHFNAENAPVVITNLSPAGAMLQASLVDSEGGKVHLVRGGLCAQATVIWCSGDRCGLQFSDEIDVEQWRAPASNGGQARVDEIISLVKAGALSNAVADAEADRAGRSSTLQDDLALVHALLKNLKDDLSRSSETLDRHASKLPYLDRAMEILSDSKLLRRSPYQLVDELGGVVELLVELEDELAHTRETVARHGYKLQHLDLAMQMLTELGSELISGGEERLSSSPRLQNLRAVCENALGAAAASKPH